METYNKQPSFFCANLDTKIGYLQDYCLTAECRRAFLTYFKADEGSAVIISKYIYKMFVHHGIAIVFEMDRENFKKVIDVFRISDRYNYNKYKEKRRYVTPTRKSKAPSFA